MSLLELLQARRSVRRFKPDAIPRETVERLVEAAVAAPSASNKQPWRFVAVTDRATIAKMAAGVREAVDRIARHIEPASAASFRGYGSYFTRFEDAPLVLVALCKRLTVLSNLVGESLPADDRSRIEAMERGSALIGAAMAMQNLLLMAHDLGLGASGMTGPLVAVDRIRAILEVPESWDVAALVPVGRPDEAPTPTERKSVSAVLRWIE